MAKMNENKISIIVPVYNVEKYIKKCLDSIVNQTYKNLEIIIINDGSTDDSLSIVEKYQKKDKRILLMNQINQGVSVARNNALKCASGDYIMFIDSDDWLELDTCHKLIDKIEKEKSDIVIFNFIKEFNSKSVKNLNYDENFDLSIKENYDKFLSVMIAPFYKVKNLKYLGLGYAFNKIIKRDCIKNVKFPFEGLCAYNEDIMFYLQLFKNAKIISLSNEFLYHYRVYDQSATFKYNKDIILVNNKTFEILNSNVGVENLCLKETISARMIYNLCKEMNLYIFNDKLTISQKNKIKLLKKEVNKEQFKTSIKNIKLYKLNKYMFVYTLLLKLKLYYVIFLVNLAEQRYRRKIL